MDSFLQIWGGVGFLLNKILLLRSEKLNIQGVENQYKKYQISSWGVYLLSLPPWIVLFAIKQNWIASALELAGAPAMILGLINALQSNCKNINQKSKKSIVQFLEICSIICIIVGVSFSLYDLKGVTRITQILEILLTSSYLIGTYLLATMNAQGYLWYILMHISCGLIMFLQGYFWLFIQQILSLFLVAWSYQIARKNLKNTKHII
jgi:hypothetical protein